MRNQVKAGRTQHPVYSGAVVHLTNPATPGQAPHDQDTHTPGHTAGWPPGFAIRPSCVLALERHEPPQAGGGGPAAVRGVLSTGQAAAVACSSDAPPPGPKISSCAVIASMSDRHVAPAANAHVASTSARPRCRTGKNPPAPPPQPGQSSSRAGRPTTAAAPSPPELPSRPHRLRPPSLCDYPSAGSPTSSRMLAAVTSRVSLPRVHADLDSPHSPRSGAPFHVQTPRKRRTKIPT